MELILTLEIVMGTLTVACLYVGLMHQDDVTYYSQVYRYSKLARSIIAKSRKLRNRWFLAALLALLSTIACVAITTYGVCNS